MAGLQDSMLKAVNREQTLTERADGQLVELIVNGSIREGDRLPSEAEMGKRLGVSRTVVREAVKLLVARGLVEVRTGSGIYVKALDELVMAQPMNLLLRSNALTVDQILEVREILEVKIAELAAKRANAEHIEKLEESVEQLSQKRFNPAEFAATDMHFHILLAKASGNPLFLVLAKAICEVMLEPLRSCARAYGEKSVEWAVISHRKVLDHVKAGDAEGARRVVEEDMAHTRRVMGPFPSSAPGPQGRRRDNGSRPSVRR